MKTILKTQGTVELSISDIRELIVKSLTEKGFKITQVRGVRPVICSIIVPDRMKPMISKSPKAYPTGRPFYGLRKEFVVAIQHFWALGWERVQLHAILTFIESRDSKYEALGLEKMTHYFTRIDIRTYLKQKVPDYTTSVDKEFISFILPKPK